MADPLLQLTPAGLFCPRGGFYVDPWLPVERAVITHAHADHARRGHQRYLTARPGLAVLRQRLGPAAVIDVATYGETLDMCGVRLSLHPAGHVLGSAQVRLEADGEVWVVSGDYKTAPDPTCTAFEPLRCHTYVTESTFGLPIYRWPDQRQIFADINAWWRDNQAHDRATVLFAYALGKAQRLLAGIDAGIGPIFGHGAVENLHQAYRDSGVALPPTRLVSDDVNRAEYRRALILAPPSAQRSPWTRRFGDYASGFASGWMLVRGARRRRAVDRGFVLSDHADWPGLLGAIGATGAQRVLVTHGHTPAMVRWLREQGLEAHALPTRFEGELDDGVDSAESGSSREVDA
jgi:putative mRNA 3-end processing factor